MKLLNTSDNLFFATTATLVLLEVLILLTYKKINTRKFYFIQKMISRLLLISTGTVFTLRAIALHRFPVGNLYEISIVLIFFSLALILVLPSFLRWIANSSLEITLLNSLLLSLAVISIFFFSSSGQLTPILYSYWLPIHVTCMILSYSFFSIAFVTSVYQLFKIKNVKQQSIQKSYMFTTIGYVLFTLSVIFGALWANAAWGNYWQWDPKETWALITWLIYTMYLHLYSIKKSSRALIVSANIVAYLSCIFNLFIVNTVISGMHSYAQ